MGFRVMRLQYGTMKEKAIIKEGVVLARTNHIADFGFAKLISLLTPSDAELQVSVIHEYLINDKSDGYKDVLLNIATSENKVENEEGILVVIRHSDLVVGKTKVAGRYPGEGIWLLKPNDKISVTRGELTEEFVALEFENRMYLVKVHEK